MTKIATMFCLLATLVAGASVLVDSAEAARLKYVPLNLDYIDLVQSDEEFDAGADEEGSTGDVTIRPRQAARIAKSAYPGAKVLKVKLLPSGVYAVTLRGDGKLTRVMVDGQSGDIL